MAGIFDLAQDAVTLSFDQSWASEENCERPGKNPSCGDSLAPRTKLVRGIAFLVTKPEQYS